jgi:hypothetical protein
VVLLAGTHAGGAFAKNSAMGSTQAKSFEWNRVSTDLSSARARLTEATARGDGEVEIAGLQELVESLDFRSRTLLEEIASLRTCGPQ